MRTSPKVTIYIITAGVALLCVAGHKGEPDNGKDLDGNPPSHIPTQTHKTGEKAYIQCRYPDSHENNVKYLCKGETPSNCASIIKTTEGERDVKVGRFDIRDNKRKKYFYVNINNLNAADSGTYWCGSDTELLHKINLSVDGGNIKTKQNDPSSKKTTSAPQLDEDHSHIGMIAGVVTCLVLLVIVVIVLIVYRNKLPGTKACCASGGSSEQRANSGQNTEDNHEYEDIRERNQLPSSGGAVSSVYAVVNPPADQLHYASVNFQNDSVSKDRNALPDTDKNGSSACDYSSISRTQQGGTNPPVLYSAVTKPGEP